MKKAKMHDKGNVLVTENSQLVSLFVLSEKKELITVDSDYMVRTWNLLTGSAVSTILIKKDKSYKHSGAK